MPAPKNYMATDFSAAGATVMTGPMGTNPGSNFGYQMAPGMSLGSFGGFNVTDVCPGSTSVATGETTYPIDGTLTVTLTQVDPGQMGMITMTASF
jgi:hypothetical protein